MFLPLLDPEEWFDEPWGWPMLDRAADRV